MLSGSSDDDTGAGGHEQHLVIHDEGRKERLKDPGGHSVGGRAIGHVLDQDRELVPADPRGGVAWAHRQREAAGNDAQHVVACAVPMGVVDVLEVVKIKHHHRHQLSGAISPRQRLVRPILEQRAIGQTGEAVVEGLLLQLLLEVPAVGDVTHGEDDPSHVWVGEQVLGDDLERTVGAVGMPEPTLRISWSSGLRVRISARCSSALSRSSACIRSWSCSLVEVAVSARPRARRSAGRPETMAPFAPMTKITSDAFWIKRLKCASLRRCCKIEESLVRSRASANCDARVVSAPCTSTVRGESIWTTNMPRSAPSYRIGVTLRLPAVAEVSAADCDRPELVFRLDADGRVRSHGSSWPVDPTRYTAAARSARAGRELPRRLPGSRRRCLARAGRSRAIRWRREGRVRAQPTACARRRCPRGGPARGRRDTPRTHRL